MCRIKVPDKCPTAARGVVSVTLDREVSEKSVALCHWFQPARHHYHPMDHAEHMEYAVDVFRQPGDAVDEQRVRLFLHQE